MGAGNDLDIRQYRNGTPNTCVFFDDAGEPVFKGAFTGATIGPDAAGTRGLVPAPTVADYYRVLGGNGAWVDLFTGGLATQVPVSNGSGRLVQSNMYVNNASNLVFLKKNGTEDSPLKMGIDAFGSYYRIAPPDDLYAYRYLGVIEHTGYTEAATGQRDINVWGTQEDVFVRVKVIAIAIKPDGSEGYSCEKAASFRRDGAADPVQVGATTVISEHYDDGVNIPSVTISPSTSFIRIAYNSGTSDSYQWTIFYEIVYRATKPDP